LVPPPKKAVSAKKGKTLEKLPYEKSEEEIITTSKVEVKQWFAKLNEEAKERRNPEKLYLYVKPEKLKKKVADHQKKQREAQKKPALLDYERSLVKSA